ncbi:alpha/beta hydrolase [Teredinibacter sp. KSP-S5-2]|uniref:alpha/beta hydrolase n=1 Tax=Teredinibacter sp. KSP-S5-2 TaxID=3034506 RepID=UPI002934192F|nr:alpha/beta hydrolase-fold protein [Teredinibacter sp. KSP-S5-2]WNO08658.1 alpha/beta hydrolase-fold protein [Teredinibacter sp. KSP-S5-2]
MKLWSLLVVFALLSVNVCAQTDFSQHSVSSKNLSQDITIQVSLPESYLDSDTFRYPVMIVLDGSTQLNHIAGNIHFLSTYAIVPEMILVGVSANNRAKNFTPTSVDDDKENTGGATQYKRFLEKELLPFLRQHYRIAPYEIITGHSLSGLFSCFIALQPDTVFDGAIAISPSLWWDNNWLVKESKVVFKQTRSSPFRWYLSLASEPDEMKTAFDQQVSLLDTQRQKNLFWHADRFPQETHDSTPAIGNLTAIRWLFHNWNAVPEMDVMPLKEIEAFYKTLAKQYGYQFPLSADQYNVYGLKAAYEGKTSWGVEILEEGVKQFPYSEVLWDSLATAQSLDGNTEMAIKASDKAVALASKKQSKWLNEILAQSSRLKMIDEPN